jgi:hypothetical protein
MSDSGPTTTKEAIEMDESPRNLHLVPGAEIASATDEEEWIEEIDESDLPPNEWQKEVDSLIELEHAVWEERMQMLEESSPEGD